MMKNFFSLALLFAFQAFIIQTLTYSQEYQTNISVHDPVMIKQEDTYYLFATGRGVAIWSSKDMKHWKREQPVFEKAPQWVMDVLPNFRNHIWAPDIYFHQGKYYLYYSVSAFGKNTSSIGVATNSTLDPADPNYKWVDQGEVIRSKPGETYWNAIDANLVIDDTGKPYLSFGSFWGGLKLVELKKDLISLAEPIDNLPTIASRIEVNQVLDKIPVSAGDNPIEAPFIFKKNGYYYLFASIDYCCRGANSTYKMIIGRSKNVTGPYLDKNNRSMEKGGGTLLLEGDKDWHGVGHNSAYTFDGVDYLVFHGYEAADNGRSKLRIEEMTWDEEGWPTIIVK